MSFAVSVYLDIVRFAAAFVVFAGHVSGLRFTGGFLWQLAPYAGPAVAIFFVLSGFVIGFVHQKLEANVRSYVISRMARIYSVALPATLLTMLLDPIGRWISPAAYVSDWGYTADHTPLQILAALTFTQKILGADLSLGSDLPYWSLNYEVFYYLLFGLAVFCRPLWLCIALIIVTGLLAGPPILAMFPLWLLGLATIRLRPWQHTGRRMGWTLTLISLLAFIVYEAWSWRHNRPLANLGPAFRGELAQDYLVTVLFLCNLVGIGAVAQDLENVAKILERPVRWLAAQTFSLYLFHLPIAQFLSAINPWTPTQPQSRLLIWCGTLGLVSLLAHVTEMRKSQWRHAMATLFDVVRNRATTHTPNP